MIRVTVLQLRLESKEKYQAQVERFGREITADLLILPPLAGCLFPSVREYHDFHRGFSGGGSFILVPGTFYEDGYHKAVIIHRGRVIHTQCQTHLAAEDKEAGLKRGGELETCPTHLGHLGLLVGNDCFHPQTGRILGLEGVDIVAGLYTAAGPYNRWRQLAGIWQQVQQNQFFAAEAAACGNLEGKVFRGRGMIHHPIWDDTTGILAELDEEKEGLVNGELDFGKRNRVKKEFPIYKYLNTELYRKEWGY